MEHPGDEVQKLYDSEINFSIDAFLESGFHVKLGDAKNGIRSAARVLSIAEAVKWLQGEARAYFPNSAYVKNLPH